MKLNLWLLLFTLIITFAGCKKEDGYYEITGDTMGSTYSIKFKGKKNFQNQIDDILKDFNALLSTYDTNSYLSRFNQNKLTEGEGSTLSDAQCLWLTEIVRISNTIYHKTNKKFNPGLGPLLRFWGFGDQTKHPETIDSSIIDSLLIFCNFDNIRIKDCKLLKEFPQTELNFNAIAAGYATDIIAAFLDSLEVTDYLIFITGEIKAKGVNAEGVPWKVGIEKPIDNKSPNPGLLSIDLEDKAMATSGNYRNFFERNGKKHGHTIDPYSGYPSKSNLLSATVISKSGAQSDALATAFMVMGFEDAKRLTEGDDSIESVLIWDENGEMKVWVSWEL